MSLQASGAWRTPLGDYPIDSELALQLQKAIPVLMEDPTSYQQEHSLEVEIPFLQKLKPEGTFVPICLSYISYAACEQLGEGIATVIQAQTEPVQIICSTDFNHYEDQATTETKDHLAIEREAQRQGSEQRHFPPHGVPQPVAQRVEDPGYPEPLHRQEAQNRHRDADHRGHQERKQYEPGQVAEQADEKVGEELRGMMPWLGGAIKERTTIKETVAAPKKTVS